MLEREWKVLHLCDIPGIQEGLPLHLAWQRIEGGPFCDTQTAEYNHAALTEMVKAAEAERRFVLWMPTYAIPVPPKQYRILHPFVCKREKPCEFEDNGYCFHGPEDCPDKMPYPEISVKDT